MNQRGEIMILTTWILSTIIFFKNSQHARTQIKFSVLQCWILKFYCKLQTTFQLLYNCNIATSNSSGVKLICRQFVDLKRSKKDNTTSFDEKGLPASIESKFRFLQVNQHLELIQIDKIVGLLLDEKLQKQVPNLQILSPSKTWSVAETRVACLISRGLLNCRDMAW